MDLKKVKTEPQISAIADNRAARSVLSYLAQNPEIIYDETYFLTPLDFEGNRAHQLIFSAINNLAMEGQSSIGEEDIIRYLSEFPKLKEEINSLTVALIQKEKIEEATFVKDYKTIKKITVIREFAKNKIFLPEISFDGFSSLDDRKNWQDMDIEDIVRLVQQKINTVENTYVSQGSVKSQLAAKGIAELYQSLKDNPEVGVPLDGEILDYILRGARFGKMYLNSAPSGHGKSIPNNTIIPTPNGYRKVSDIKVGDSLFDRFGNITKVIGVFPQGRLKNFKITFEDGRVAHSSEDHIWTIVRDGNLVDLTLKEVMDKAKEDGYLNAGKFNFNVPLNYAAKYPEKDLPFDPYSYGAAINIDYVTAKDDLFSISNLLDYEIVEKISKNNNWTINQASNGDYLFKKENYKNVLYKDIITEDFKKELLVSSIDQRTEFLKGLVNKTGRYSIAKGIIEIEIFNKEITNNVVEIMRSLGLKTSIKQITNKYSDRIIIEAETNSPELYIKKSSFLAASKHLRPFNRVNGIVAIQELEKETPMTCFLVDNEEHLFLTENYTVTHNTRFMVGNACAIAYPRIENGQVIVRKDLRPVLFVTTEQQADEIQTMILAYISGVNEEQILYGKATPEEEFRIMQAIEIMKMYEKNFVIEVIPDPSIALVRAKITRHIYQNQTQIIFYDYIFSSPGLLGEFRDVKVREDVALMMLSNTLKEIAATNNVFIQSATQLNDKWETTMVRNQNHIRGSKAIVDKADVGMTSIKLNDVQEEMLKVKQITEQAGIEMPNVVVDLYKNRRGKFAGIKLFRKFDYGTCRSRDIMLTTNTHAIIKDYDKISYDIRSVDFLELLTERKEEMEGNSDV